MPPPRSSLLRLTPLLRPLLTHLTHTHLPIPHPPPHPSPPLVLRLHLRQQQQQKQYSTTAPPSPSPPPTSTPTQSQSPSPSPKPYTFTDIQHLSTSPSPTRLIIDVREPAELRATGKIPGALSMPLTSNPDAFYLDGGAFFERFGFEKPRARARVVGGGGGGEGGEGKEGGGDDGEAQGGVEEVIFYCKAGVRSRAAARMAREWVGVRAGDMKGGWMEWEAKGGEVES